jgi:hypothetical protein
MAPAAAPIANHLAAWPMRRRRLPPRAMRKASGAARRILRQDRNERPSESLIKIRHELVARHLLEFAVVAGTVLIRQMPVHVVGIPPRVLQALPEEPRLPDARDFLAPRDHALLTVLPHQFAERVHQFRLQIIKPLVVRSELDRRVRSASILLARTGAAVAHPFRGEAFRSVIAGTSIEEKPSGLKA